MEEKVYYNNHRRVRAGAHIRELTSTVTLTHKEFIQPLFVDESIAVQTPVQSLNDIYSDSITTVLLQIEKDIEKGISKFLLFPVPQKKSENNFDFSFAIQCIKAIKNKFGNKVWIAADVCLCAYTSHSHCGILNEQRDRVLNNESVQVLADYALQLAMAGADCIAPSDMMDGRIAAIRNILDENQLDDVTIMSYSSKFSSQYYGPFRDACKSAPGSDCKITDRKTYQISAFNKNDAISSTLRDIKEGADIVMVKPAVPYLDIIHELSKTIHQTIAAYHVSGEYQSIELMAMQNLIDREKAHVETWTSLKRGGAGIIISYAARYAQEWIARIKM